MLNDYAVLSITEENAFNLWRGRVISVNDELKAGQIMQLMINNKIFIGMAKSSRKINWCPKD